MDNKDDEDAFFRNIENEKQKIAFMKEQILATIPASQIACRKCKNHTVNYQERSIRRPDEPPVMKFTCSTRTCGFLWFEA